MGTERIISTCRYEYGFKPNMTANKTATLNLKIAPELKQTLKTVAKREQCSLANMVEVMIRNYCETKKANEFLSACEIIKDWTYRIHHDNIEITVQWRAG